MSEDDIDMLGPDGQGSFRVDRDRRAPRFSWTPAYETTFFRSLCDSVQLGLRENSSFKAEAWERAAQALQDRHGAYPAKSHLINKSDNARKRFRLWRGLRENPEFVYNSVSKTVTATEDAWRAHIEREPLSRALRGRPFDHEEYMDILYPDVIGSGGAPKRIMKPRRRTDRQPSDESEMPGTSVLNLQPESSNGHAGEDSPGPARSSPSHTPTGAAIAAGLQTVPTSASLAQQIAPTQPSALTPPDEPANQAKRRALLVAQGDGIFGTTSSPPSISAGRTLLSTDSPGKRQRTSYVGDSASLSSMLPRNILPELPSSELPSAALSATLIQSPPEARTEGHGSNLLLSLTGAKWCEMALEQFFRDFANEDMDLQIQIAEKILVVESKALIYCKMPRRVKQHWIKRLEAAFRKSP